MCFSGQIAPEGVSKKKKHLLMGASWKPPLKLRKLMCLSFLAHGHHRRHTYSPVAKFPTRINAPRAHPKGGHMPGKCFISSRKRGSSFPSCFLFKIAISDLFGVQHVVWVASSPFIPLSYIFCGQRWPKKGHVALRCLLGITRVHQNPIRC